MTKALVIILAAVTLDAIGMGLVMPVLPGLLRELTGEGQVATTYGLLLAAYGVMQFLFAPVLGALSDRFGRRPVLLVSLFGGALDYLFMAAAPALWMLALGRIIAGVTAANMAVAAAYIADTTSEKQRATAYGYMSACFGLGLIVGPALGGLLGGLSLRAPFIAAAALTGLNLVLALFILPESHRGVRQSARFSDFNALASLVALTRLKGLRRLLCLYVILQIAGQIPAALWVLSSEERFGWNTGTVGLSLAAFGALSALMQAFATGPVTKRFGERRGLVLGLITDGAGYLLVALATRGWVAFAALPLLALGGVAQPALQALMSFTVAESEQGELQGSLAGLASLVGIIAPLAATSLYAVTAGIFSGAVWLAGAALQGIGLMLLTMVAQPAREAAR
ncbi:Tet(A)/Tet(B)/Tet(C) family tetracycline efflux MFS transporter [Mesorhizobium sp. RMAD-H1]|uniref:Tet(A)/Tet(B)/Tet(C) family tetracycline efflux MFS transporter n=1 Tax=Mesorhizobium sp. RMAD-H1 TaxID=2587065 RepID=UPI00161A93C0|nr:Tet(A)/Tet(B)/Tet(C) family tetracycline efflux MFS transporter [Mesorhizobium sp. RMAD-H1]MBB2973050.1 DHA1 family tetracycline resistance protein-like MFS transporter [Mesorhizobium sp. RMAD-H1]